MILVFALLFTVIGVVYALGALEVYETDSPNWSLVWAVLSFMLATYCWVILF